MVRPKIYRNKIIKLSGDIIIRTNDTQFNYLFEKIYELVELADFDIDDEDLMAATKSVIDNLELDERFYHKKKNVTDEDYSECVDKLVDSM